MKITPIILSIPPYISTTWNQVSALQKKGDVLAVSLKNGETVMIPDLNPATIDLIFRAHAASLEMQANADMNAFLKNLSNAEGGNLDVPFRLGFSATPDGIGAALQHNPAQADAPDLPKVILQKIAAIAKIVAPEEAGALPVPENNCNCMHCQIARAIQEAIHPKKGEGENEEIVSDAELTFQEWDIVQTGDKLFSVINRLDNHEKYSVYLGQPIGCTCGKPNCEHILAVLKS